MGWAQLNAIYALSKKGIKVNCTCIFTEEQCVLAANAGASYVSIFHCRLKDIGGDPVKVIADTDRSSTRPAMMRRLSSGASAWTDILEAHLAVHILTAGAKIIEQMSSHPATDKSVQGFLKDFQGWMS